MAKTKAGGKKKVVESEEKGAKRAAAAVDEPPAKKAAKKVAVAKEEVGEDENIALGQIRFAEAASAQKALELDGQEIAGATMSVRLDERSKDGTKILVSGLPSWLKWGALKDKFSSCGEVAFSNIMADAGAPCAGKIRFETAELAQKALALNGTVLGGKEITVKPHSGSKDGTKLQVLNLPAGCEWFELKDHFAKAGLEPVFCQTAGNSNSTPVSAEVRFENADDAKTAVSALNNSELGGGKINVELDARSPDATKLLVTKIPPGLEWQELKDHFSQCGKVAFSKIQDPITKGSDLANGAKVNMTQQALNILSSHGLAVTKDGVIRPFKSGVAGGHSGFGWRGQIRFTSPEHSQLAVKKLHKAEFKGYQLSVVLDKVSHDGTKLIISGVPPGTTWQELKDHFGTVGQVAFAVVTG